MHGPLYRGTGPYVSFVAQYSVVFFPHGSVHVPPPPPPLHRGPPPIRVDLTESAGRGVFATRPVSAGELLHSVQPLVCHPSPSLLHEVCYSCLRRNGPPPIRVDLTESAGRGVFATRPVSAGLICADAMRLGRRAIFPLVRTATTTSTPAASSPPEVLSVGHALREQRRFTEADVAAYAAVSGDRNPVHLDDGAARELGGFQRGRVVHGILVASLFPSIIAARFPGAVYASQTLKFAAPVYIGDDVVAQVQALHISKTSRYVVKFATKCFTDEEEGSLAIEGEAMVVLPTLDLSSESTMK